MANYEEETTASGTRKIHYIPGGDGLAGVLIKDNANPAGKMYYTYSDHLGSIVAITDNTGTIIPNGEQSLDPWGRRRNPVDWSYNNILAFTLLDRGYTGHEHLNEFGIINMNGRLYDPVLGRILSPDPALQMPGNTQNFNRYSYCLNNPLKYTDPSGYLTISNWDEFWTIANYLWDNTENNDVGTWSDGGIPAIYNSIGAAVDNGWSVTHYANFTGDDYFRMNGSYLGFSEDGTRSVLILTKNDIPNGFWKNESMRIVNSLVGLSNSEIVSNAYKMGLINMDAITKIFEYYEQVAGLDVYIENSNSNFLMQYSGLYDPILKTVCCEIIYINQTKWLNYRFIDNFYNILNAFIHEKAHYESFNNSPILHNSLSLAERELFAISNQFNDQSWTGCTDDFQMNAIDYALKFTTGYLPEMPMGTNEFLWQIDLTIGNQSYSFSFHYYNSRHP